MRLARVGWVVAMLPVVAVWTGCHSYHVETTVENRTGEAIQLLEVDYPSASFGKNALAADADFHYRFQVNGAGRLKVIYYKAKSDVPIQNEGPQLNEGQEGRLEIVLLPQGKADFRTELAPRR